jgi:hypothetical protein
VSERWDGTWVIYPKAHTVADRTQHTAGLHTRSAVVFLFVGQSTSINIVAVESEFGAEQLISTPLDDFGNEGTALPIGDVIFLFEEQKQSHGGWQWPFLRKKEETCEKRGRGERRGFILPVFSSFPGHLRVARASFETHHSSQTHVITIILFLFEKSTNTNTNIVCTE